MTTLEGRHLVFAYASVALIQGSYFLWILRNWLKLAENPLADAKKATKPVD